jgi:DNA topoisomerase I
MANNLVIVESPAKAKTINKYLGNDFEVLASFGHIRDLPSKDGSVRPDDDFAMDYEFSDKSKKHVQEIVRAAKDAKNIYLASDPDREGEAIAWHVIEALRIKKALKDDVNVKRVVFNEITKNAVKEAFVSPRDIDMNLVNSQQSRRALDYLVGFTLSPVLWRKLPGSKSAGRVQSVALRLICERDYEIAKFVTREYWSIKGDFLNQESQKFTARLISYNEKKLDKFDIVTEAQAKDIEELLKDKIYTVTSIEKKRTHRYPSPPFITSTLQQEASRKLGFNASKTMQVAQKLYEGVDINGETIGLITYMRTDGVQLSKDAVEVARSYIKSTYGEKYIPEAARVYKSKVKNAQEAHEAIRPTDVNRIPSSIASALTPDQAKLYDLIWKRTLACQMQAADIDQTIVDIESSDKKAGFRANGSIMVFDGFYRVYSEGKDDPEEEDDDEKKLLPEIKDKEKVNLDKIETNQHFTEPLPRYSEASLVKKMEELGIGRPSTYASIISVLQDRDYVRLEKKRFISEDRGKIVIAFLMLYFKQYVEYDFTAQLEDELDLVSSGNMNWKDLLRKFWQDFDSHIIEAKEKKNGDIAELVSENLVSNLALKDYPKTCPKCNEGKLNLRTGKFGLFYACSKYPECKNTMPYGDSAVSSDGVSSQNNDKILGNYNDEEVKLKKGPYGFYFQLGDGKTCKRSSLPKFIDPEDANLEQAIRLFSMPISLGEHPSDGNLVLINLGRFGPYISYNQLFFSLPNKSDLFTLNLDQAVKIIAEDKKKDSKAVKPSKTKKA